MKSGKIPSVRRCSGLFLSLQLVTISAILRPSAAVTWFSTLHVRTRNPLGLQFFIVCLIHWLFMQIVASAIFERNWGQVSPSSVHFFSFVFFFFLESRRWARWILIWWQSVPKFIVRIDWKNCRCGLHINFCSKWTKDERQVSWMAKIPRSQLPKNFELFRIVKKKMSFRAFFGRLVQTLLLIGKCHENEWKTDADCREWMLRRMMNSLIRHHFSPEKR